MPMQYDILTLFPAMFEGPLSASILGKAVDRGLVRVHLHNLRDWAEGRHQVTDDTPYGGGDGMVMKVEPVARALAELREQRRQSRVLLMSPQGKTFRQADAERLSRAPGLIFVCGRYEGYDERIRSLVDEELSLGDFVRACSVPPAAPSPTASATVCSNTRNTPARRNSTACACRTC
jgi:tRNA (guanine37-N1)-methyltransferase